MTRFKKCDYCKRANNKLIKLKDTNKLFDPRKEHITGKGLDYQDRPVIIFLCKMCYEYMFPNDPDPMKSDKYITDNLTNNPPELLEIYREKKGYFK